MDAFNRFEKEISKECNKLKHIKVKQGNLSYLITKNRLNSLYESYRPLFFEKDYISFPYRDKDLAIWLVVLRYHFKLWVELDTSPGFFNLYKNFPETFIVTKEVNKENHRHLEETISEGTILYLARDIYGVVNWLNGIPLAKNEAQYSQINYTHIKPYIY